MGDLVDETLRGIRERLKELAPAVAEYGRLEAAYAALDGPSGGSGEGRKAGADTAGRRRGAGGGRRAGSAVRRAGSRAKRGQNKAAVFAVIEQRPGVTVAELASVTGIAKPLIYNTTRAGIARGELERVALPGGPHGFKIAQSAPANESSRSPG
jgi:hypothetical protein